MFTIAERVSSKKNIIYQAWTLGEKVNCVSDFQCSCVNQKSEEKKKGKDIQYATSRNINIYSKKRIIIYTILGLGSLKSSATSARPKK